MRTERLEFAGHAGGRLAARLDRPEGARGYALFAHCFTCSKDLLAVRRIATGLARHGIATLRFDFTGLGSSDGEFGSTSFSSNVGDLKRAAEHLTRTYEAPRLLIGHSLGGAAALAAAADIPGVQAVATIGAPADVAHVLKSFGSDLATVEAEGIGRVSLQGRNFTIERQFVEDARGARLTERIGSLRKPVLILHSPTDDVVGIDNAAAIFAAARHPKSFVSLDGADHLLTRAADAEFAADVIAGWASRHMTAPVAEVERADAGPVLVTETLAGRFQQRVDAHGHLFFADEPKADGGLNTGPNPYDFLAVALGTCTTMTLRLYAEKKGLDLPRLSVEVEHAKVHAEDCAECAERPVESGRRIDRFERRIRVEGGATGQLTEDLLRIANRCPVHRTLEASSVVATRIVDAG